MAWGCAPSKIVLLETKMIHSFFQTIKERYNRKTLAVTFPNCIDDLIANAGDENWEVYKTNQLQHCTMYYSSNKVVKSVGHVFISTKCKSINNIEILPPGEARDAKLKEMYVPVRMKNAKVSEEKALADFENLTEKEREF